jgi:hypothetical protein
MRRLAGAVVLVVCAVCAGAAGAHRFAGMSRADAAVQATGVVRAFAPSRDEYQDARVFGQLHLVDVLRQRDSLGREAWLALFRYRGHHDWACVWVRRADRGPSPYAYEEAQSVATGRSPERVHDRCAALVFHRHLLGPDDEGGREYATPYAYPVPVSLFGPIARGSYLADLEDTDGLSLSGVAAKLPQTTAPGTSGLEGFVIDERTWRVIPGARMAVAPSTRLSGFWRIAKQRLHGIEVTADRHGSFAILDLPARRLGYDFVISAPGYGIRYVVHELTSTGLYAGDLQLGRTARFEDDTPGPPPCGSSCSG